MGPFWCLLKFVTDFKKKQDFLKNEFFARKVFLIKNNSELSANLHYKMENIHLI